MIKATVTIISSSLDAAITFPQLEYTDPTNSSATVLNDATSPTYSASVEVGETLVLPKTNLSLESSSLGDYKSAVSISLSYSDLSLQRIPCRPKRTGMTVSYITYDSAWQDDNGAYDYSGDATTGNPMILSDFWNLRNTNSFGHYKRFTNVSGGYWDETTNTYHESDGTTSTKSAIFGEYAIDWHTFIGWATTIQGVKNFTSHVNTAATFEVAGFSGFRMANMAEHLTLCEGGGGGTWVTLNRCRHPDNTAPIFSSILSTMYTADLTNSTNASSFNGALITIRGITSSTNALYCRNHF